MKKILTSSLLVILCLLFFITTEAFSFTYYVDANKGKDEPDCGKTQKKACETIQFAIDETFKERLGEELTIEVAAGTYNENITIKRDQTTLNGTGAVIDGLGQDGITIDGFQRVTISGFTIQNGYDGVNCKGGSACKLKNLTVQDCDDEGIQIRSSAAVITDCTVLRCGGNGIGSAFSSSAILEGAIVTNNNGRSGILADAASAIISFEYPNTTILSENNRTGIILWGTSWFYAGLELTMTLRNNDIGFEVKGSSDADINGPLLVEDSDNRGISITGNSSVKISHSASVTVSSTKGEGIGIVVDDVSSLNGSWGGELIVENNSTNGIWVLRGSSFQTEANFSTQIRGNDENGMEITQNSIGRLRSGTIQGNNYYGIRVVGTSKLFASNILVDNNGNGVLADDGSTAWCDNSTVNGNTGDDVVLSFGSRASLYGGSIGTISCDGTVLIRGGYSCP
jgi:hypothetical protein